MENFKTNTRILSILVLFLFVNINMFAQSEALEERSYIKIEIKGMACPYCAYGMEKELKNISGVENVEIELKEGLAFISTPIKQKPSKESLEKIIEDAGFTVGKIEFNEIPFK
ncbi:MAG: hypothetical protein COB12_08605 [Flavobacterium sp.]|nr:MAG: hypothetical protein COB12_08605 [Flavobacterium sp.]